MGSAWHAAGAQKVMASFPCELYSDCVRSQTVSVGGEFGENRHIHVSLQEQSSFVCLLYVLQ